VGKFGEEAGVSKGALRKATKFRSAIKDGRGALAAVGELLSLERKSRVLGSS